MRQSCATQVLQASVTTRLLAGYGRPLHMSELPSYREDGFSSTFGAPPFRNPWKCTAVAREKSFRLAAFWGGTDPWDVPSPGLASVLPNCEQRRAS